ncbi:hypothetical protein GGX14DRAFT_475122 [Mycena pura]|uniref:DUF6534 domain-containing protein n=1 Tax=Mycena pura TaxID=153505 RepID=A0AAD6UUP7_9AGAR|nr:hypothetical protein GGX14DRAFT_475122 [Mycena pura]
MTTPAPPSTGPTVDVRLSYGPLLIGIFFNMILYGVLIGQQLTYFKMTRRDPLWITALVWGVFVVETANTVFDMYMMYQPLILEYGAVPNLLPTLFVTQPLCVLVVGFPIQLFFIWRIRTLTQKRLVPGIILVFACVAVGGGIWTTVLIPIVATFQNIPRLYRSAQIWLITSGVTDLCIAASLASALRSKKTGFTVTDSVVDKIIRMTVQTGLVTALFSILDVVCFLTLRGKTVNFVWNIPLSKLYSNCLLSTLNARENLKTNMSGSRGQHGNFVLSGQTFAGASDRKLDGQRQMPTALDTFAQEPAEMIGGQEEYGIRMTKVVEVV